MNYIGRKYCSNIQSVGFAPGGEVVRVRPGDVFFVASIYSETGDSLCEYVRGGELEPKGTVFLAHPGWLREFCTHIGTHVVEPECMCLSPAMHNRDCAWIVWKQEIRRKNRGRLNFPRY